MSCTCNNNCDFECTCCTPSGVLDLPVCVPVDPCEGNIVDLNCVIYDGPDFSCIGVYSGTNIIDVMNIIFQHLNPLC